jgi:hypothetical protein
MRNFITCNLLQILLRSKNGGLNGRGHETRMGEMRNSYKTSVDKTGRKIPLGELRIEGRIILKLILRK